VKCITTFQSPPADNLYRLVKVHYVHNYEQPLLLWAVIAGLQARPKMAAGRAANWPGNCGPGQAKNFRPVHISTSFLPLSAIQRCPSNGAAMGSESVMRQISPAEPSCVGAAAYSRSEWVSA